MRINLEIKRDLDYSKFLNKDNQIFCNAILFINFHELFL